MQRVEIRNCISRLPYWLLAFSLVTASFFCARLCADEVTLSNEEFKQLDTFEGNMLSKADKSFIDKEYKRAAIEYDAFVLEFAKSSAAPYALLRKARCVHLVNKRFDAMKIYQQVFDDYPSAVNAAAPALYYIGLSYVENGEPEKATKAWSQMARDPEYSKHPLAATTINRLAEIMVKQGKAEPASVFQQQAAEDFRTRNPESAREAIAHVADHCIVTMQEPRLRKFYEQVHSFEGDPQKLTGNGQFAPQGRNYWERVREGIKRDGNFSPEQQDKQEVFYRYWAGAMEGSFPDWDEYQIDLANFHKLADKDAAKWIERLDRVFAGGTADQSRVIKWIRAYGQNKAKVKEYYTKLDFAKLNSAQLIELMQVCYDEVKDNDLGGNVESRLKLPDIPDNQKQWLAAYLSPRDPGRVAEVCQNFTDRDAGRMALLHHYWERRDLKKGVALADELALAPQQAKEAAFIKGLLLDDAKEYDKAILAYQMAARPPDTLWRISECYFNAGKLDKAVGQLREVENFFKDYSAEAALRAAHLYQRANQKEKYRVALRLVLTKYPQSPQSSAAHQESNAIDAANGGGVNADGQ